MRAAVQRQATHLERDFVRVVDAVRSLSLALGRDDARRLQLAQLLQRRQAARVLQLLLPRLPLRFLALTDEGGETGGSEAGCDKARQSDKARGSSAAAATRTPAALCD